MSPEELALMRVMSSVLQSRETDKTRLSAKITEHKLNLEALSNWSSKSDQKGLIHLGLDLWAEKSHEEAEEYYKRLIVKYSNDLECMSEKSKVENDLFVKLRELSEGPASCASQTTTSVDCNQAQSPVVEIKETLNDEGEVMTCTLNDVPFEICESRVTTCPLNDESATKYVARSNQSEQTILERNSARSESSEIYELELIAEEFDQESDMSNDAESSDDDEDMSMSGNVSLLPSNSSMASRFLNEVIKLRKSKAAANDETKGLNRRQKAVHFKDTLDIREIENVSEELAKVKHEKQGVLRFKVDRISSQQGNSQLTRKFGKEKPNGHADVHRDIEEDSDGSDLIVSELVEEKNMSDPEFEDLQRQILIEKEKRKTSHFRKMISQNPSLNPHSISAAKFKPEAVITKCDSESILQQLDDLKVSELLTSPPDELHKLVLAYTRGDFDDDLDLMGLGATMNSRDRSSEVQHVTKISKEITTLSEADDAIPRDLGVENYTSGESDDEIMTELIIERDAELYEIEGDHYSEGNADNYEARFLNDEIEESYKKLKAKLMQRDNMSRKE